MKLKQRIIFQKLLFILEPPIDPVNNVSISQQVYKIKQTNYWLNEAFCVSFIFHTKCDKGTANAYWLFIILINSQWWQIWLIYIYHLTNAARRHFNWWSPENNRFGYMFCIYLHLFWPWNVFFYTVFICKHVCIHMRLFMANVEFDVVLVDCYGRPSGNG